MAQREQLLLGTLVELADNLVDDFDVIDLLSRLSGRCVDLFDVAAAGVMLVAPSGLLHVVASSSDSMRVLEVFEVQADEGPCVDCLRSGRPVSHPDLRRSHGLWPGFTPLALADGFHSVLALPLRLRGRTVGALNMFMTSSGALNTVDELAAQSLADIATIAIVQHQVAVDAQILTDQLTTAIASRVIIEQAKGRISEAADVDMDQAFQRIRNHARRHNLLLTDLSRSIANGKISASSLDPL